MSTEAKPLPLLVLGEARRRALVARLSASVRPWLKDWNASPEANITIAVARVTDGAAVPAIAAATRVAVASVQGVPQLFALTSDDGLAQVLGLPRLTTFVDSSGGTLALDVAHELVRSLAKVVAEDAGLKNNQVEVSNITLPTQNEAMRQRHWWAAMVDCGMHRAGAFQGVLLVISPQFIEMLVPATAHPRTAELERRAAAILDDAVRLQVVLGEAQLTVGELASLGVNDVIVLKEDLSHAASLLTREGKRVANASLGRVGNQRAVSMCR